AYAQADASRGHFNLPFPQSRSVAVVAHCRFKALETGGGGVDADDRIGQDPPDLPPIPALLWDKGQQFLFSILGDPEVEVMSEAQYKVLNPAGGLLTT